MKRHKGATNKWEREKKSQHLTTFMESGRIGNGNHEEENGRNLKLREREMKEKENVTYDDKKDKNENGKTNNEK